MGGGIKTDFPLCFFVFSKLSTRNMLFLFLKMIFKICRSCILKTSPADMEQRHSKVGHGKEQMPPQEIPAPVQPLKLHGLPPATEQREWPHAACSLQHFPPTPQPSSPTRTRPCVRGNTWRMEWAGGVARGRSGGARYPASLSRWPP